MSGFEAERGGRLPRLGNNWLSQARGWLARRQTLITHDLMGDAISSPRGERGTALPDGSDWSSIRQAGSDGKPHESEHDHFASQAPRAKATEGASEPS